jgi:hypothetical protein
MKLGTFMAIAAVIAFVFGLGFILVPAQTLALYGTTLDESGQWVARYLGSAFIGIAVVGWFARNAAQNGAMRAIILGFFVLSITGLIVAVLDALYGTGGSALLWSTVVIYLFLALGFGYFQFTKPAES